MKTVCENCRETNENCENGEFIYVNNPPLFLHNKIHRFHSFRLFLYSFHKPFSQFSQFSHVLQCFTPPGACLAALWPIATTDFLLEIHITHANWTVHVKTAKSVMHTIQVLRQARA